MKKSNLSIRGNAENIDKWKEEKIFKKPDICLFVFFFRAYML